jgi:glutaredoxin
VFNRDAALIALTLAAPLAVAAGIHKWTDADGNVHFGDRPPWDAASEVVSVRPNVYESPSIEALADVLARPDTVVMYSTRWCGHCKRARQYFQANGIGFEEYDVETSAKGRRDYARLDAKGVPVILVGDQRLNGFSAEAFERVYRPNWQSPAVRRRLPRRRGSASVYRHGKALAGNASWLRSPIHWIPWTTRIRMAGPWRRVTSSASRCSMP